MSAPAPAAIAAPPGLGLHHVAVIVALSAATYMGLRAFERWAFAG